MSNLLYLIGVIAMIWVIYDVWINQKGMDGLSKIIWTVCAIIFSVITAIVYYFMKKR